jgi:flagellar biosynthesis/type III secretory pathway M-ring protein FliF/YscJ
MKKMKEMWNDLSKKGKILVAVLVVIAGMIVYGWVF